MTLFQGAGALFSLIAVFGYINNKFFKLPSTLGLTAVGVIIAVGFSMLSWLRPEIAESARNISSRIDFSEIVLRGLLSPLLFASALFVDISSLKRFKAAVFMLATAGVVISTAIVGVGLYFATQLLHQPVSFLGCLLFGALISPTDPIAVLAVLKNAKVSKKLETKIIGESLFNDGTAVVIFISVLGLATGTTQPNVDSVILLLLKEVLGGLAIGFAMGYGASILLKSLDNSSLEIILTLALATAGYSFAEALHVSAPLAVVAAGLVVGDHGAMQDSAEFTRKHLFAFWERLEELLMLLLFGLMALKLTGVNFRPELLLLGSIAILVVLVARAVSVAVPLSMLRLLREGSADTIKILTWGGLRGGISVALALSLPEFAGKDIIVGITFIVVVFSLLVQATTLERLVKRLALRSSLPGSPVEPPAMAMGDEIIQ